MSNNAVNLCALEGWKLSYFYNLFDTLCNQLLYL